MASDEDDQPAVASDEDDQSANDHDIDFGGAESELDRVGRGRGKRKQTLQPTYQGWREHSIHPTLEGAENEKKIIAREQFNGNVANKLNFHQGTWKTTAYFRRRVDYCPWHVQYGCPFRVRISECLNGCNPGSRFNYSWTLRIA